jgi:hypothetical protein
MYIGPRRNLTVRQILRATALTLPPGSRSVGRTDLAISWGENVRRLLIAVLTAAAFMTGTAGVAHALRDPIIVCVREPCGPQLPELPPLPHP